MKFLVAWPNWGRRQDRGIMFSHLAEWIDEVYLISGVEPPPTMRAQMHPRCRVISVGEGVMSWRFAQAAYRWARTPLAQAAQKREHVLIQEMNIVRLVPMMLLTQPRNAKTNVRTVLSLYSPSAVFLRARGWRRQPEERLSWSQEQVHWRVQTSRVAREFISTQMVDAVTGNSDEIRDSVIRDYRKDPTKVFTIPTSIDTEFFRPAAYRGDGIPVILFLGRMLTRKGVFDLIGAAKVLRERGHVFKLRLIGERDVEKMQVEKAVAESGLGESIELIDWQPREGVRDELQRAAMLVLPTYGEGSPRVVKEAMACACPVVASDLPPIRSLNPREEALTLFPVKNVTALADSMEMLLRNADLRKQKGKWGRHLAEHSYSSAGIARETYDIYSRLFQPEF